MRCNGGLPREKWRNAGLELLPDAALVVFDESASRGAFAKIVERSESRGTVRGISKPLETNVAVAVEKTEAMNEMCGVCLIVVTRALTDASPVINQVFRYRPHGSQSV